MNDPIFELETDTKKKFIMNRDTGRWVIADRIDGEVIEQVSRLVGKTESFTGTSLIVLNTGRKCNLRCKYCHVGELKEQNEDMPPEVGRKAIDRVLELDERDRHIVFHGSEPFMNLGLLKELVSYSKDKGDKIRFSVQSNGTLFGESALDFLHNQGVVSGLSFDGLRQHQDATRPYANGASTYERIIDGISALREKQGGLSVITVVSKYNVNDLEEIANDFEARGIESVLFSLLYPPIQDSSIAPDNNLLFDNMKIVLDNYIEKTIEGQHPIKIRNLRDTLRTFFKEKTTDNCVQCGGGKTHPLIAIDIDGSIYPCDFFWGRKEYSIGNIFNNSLRESFNSTNNFRVFRSLERIDECYNNCDWVRFCGAGCPGGSVVGEKGIASKSIYCDYYKELFGYVAGKIPFLHETGLLGKMLEIEG